MTEPSHRAQPPRRESRAPALLALSVGVLGAALVATATLVSFSEPAPADEAAAPVASSLQGSVAARVADPLPPAPQRVAKRGAPIERVPQPTPAAQPAGAAALASAAEQAAGQSTEEPAGTAARAVPSGGPFEVRVGSFNVLGSQHTRPGGDRAGWPAASTRTAGAAGLVAEHGIEILGTQELQDDQLRDLSGRLGMQAWPGTAWGVKETDNSVLYDGDRFEFVSGERWTITFMGRPRPQPIVRLRERATGSEFYVVNTHPSAGDGQYAAERRRAQDTLVGVLARLQQTGLPVLVTGDMNDRETFFCRVVAPAGAVAANGGSHGGGCNPPPQPIPVDWVVGDGGVSFEGYWRDTRPVDRKISNHFLISARATVG